MATIRKRSWTTAKGESRVAWTVDFFDAQGERQRRQFAMRKEADAFRVEIEGQLRTGTFRIDAAKVVVQEVADRFLEHCERRLKRGERMTQKNYNTYAGHVRNYICPDSERQKKGKRFNKRMRPFRDGIAKTKIGQLTPRAVSDLCDRLRDAGVSVQTTRKILGTVKVMLEYAVLRDFVAVNVARSVEVIGRRDEGAKKIIPPEKDVIRRIIDVAQEDFRVQIIVASATGLRAGEHHALRWHHVDLERGEIKVETRVDAYGNEDVTKTAAGMRTIPIAAPVVTALKAWKLRTKRKKSGDLVFPGVGGGYANHDSMVRWKFDPCFDRLERLHTADPARHPPPPARCNWHALRHFAISCWIEAGLSPKTVQTFAGHSSLQMTMDRYGHLFKSDDHKRAMDAIAKELY